MIYIGIDPGSTHSAWATLIGPSDVVTRECDNAEMSATLFGWGKRSHFILGIEYIDGSYGPSFGKDHCQTLFWSGRFAEAWSRGGGKEATLLTRSTVFTRVTGQRKASDAVLRQAIIDLWGGDEALKGRKCQECKGKGIIGGKVKGVACSCEEGWAVPPNALNGQTTGTHRISAIAVALALRGGLQP